MKYEEQERKIYAKYDDKTIRVYQAYNNVIADEAIKLGTFGEHFSLTRMTWIDVVGRKKKIKREFWLLILKEKPLMK